jgi:alanine-glyoxylate transaminase/serine-glyoxylate transaminase/serine-pyruvate transaminase
VRYPDGLEDKAFRARYLEEGVVVAGGLAETAGRVFRMGHLGNLTADQALFALEALEKTLAGLSRPVSPGSGRRAAEEVLART